jgi:hypothetical protein
MIDGSSIIGALIWLVCLGLIFWLLFWLINYVALPEPFAKVAKVILALAAVVLLINVILTIAGHPLIAWHRSIYP